MKRATGLLAVVFGLLVSGAAFGQQTTKPAAKPVGPATISSELNTELSIVEHEFVGAAEAMPEDKYNFAPATSMGEYKGVRTFAMEVKHVATANFAFTARFSASRCRRGWRSEKERTGRRTFRPKSRSSTI